MALCVRSAAMRASNTGTNWAWIWPLLGSLSSSVTRSTQRAGSAPGAVGVVLAAAAGAAKRRLLSGTVGADASPPASTKASTLTTAQLGQAAGFRCSLVRQLRHTLWPWTLMPRGLATSQREQTTCFLKRSLCPRRKPAESCGVQRAPLGRRIVVRTGRSEPIFPPASVPVLALRAVSTTGVIRSLGVQAKMSQSATKTSVLRRWGVLVTRR